MFTIFIRSVMLYIFMLVILRGMGRRQQRQFQPYEFAAALLVADLIAVPMADVSTPLLQGVLPVAALFILHSAIALLGMRSDRFRAFVSGKPSVIVKDGVIDRRELNRLCLSLSDLLEGIRESGILDPASVGTAIVEADGGISAFEDAQNRPATVNDLSLAPPRSGLPLTLIMDGKVQRHNLQIARRDEKWLADALKPHGLAARAILFASLNVLGELHVQDMAGATHKINALAREEVAW
jgi:uncharacterized membrane protein YcaP (DUF421 family)